MYDKLKSNRYFNYFEVKKKHDRDSLNLSREELLEEYAKEKERLAPFMN